MLETDCGIYQKKLSRRQERLYAMTKYLVVYFSWTGNTAKVANLLAKTLSADIEEIHDVKPRGGLFAFISAAFASVFRMAAPIKAATNTVADYDVVILGCPVWAQNIATPMRSYIRRERSQIKQVALFCTLGGAGGAKAITRLTRLCERTALAHLAIEEPTLASGTWRDLTTSFAARITASQVPPRAADVG